MSDAAPLATVEARWFFGRDDARYEPIRRWFPTARLGPDSESPRPVAWAERTDVYLLIPSAEDMGVKWREGQLQIKGRIASLGAQRFGERHHGIVERWLKWSYAELPAAYLALFEDKHAGLVTIPVRKRRALRTLRLDPSTGAAAETSPDADLSCRIDFEFTEVVAGGQAYGTLAFEAYPDDEAMRPLFLDVASRFVIGLDAAQLAVAESQSYPAWLASLAKESGNFSP